MRWLALALALAVVLEIALAQAVHRTRAELETQASGRDPEAAIYALHVLANRGDTVVLGEERTRALLASEHAVEREFAMTWDLTRTGGKIAQEGYLELELEAGERARCDFYFRHQVLRPTLARLREYLRARGEVD